MKKSDIWKILPEQVHNNYKLYRNKQRSKIKFAEIEKSIDEQYYQIHKSHINWDAPLTYAEKLNYSKLYCQSTLKTMLGDKASVREWIQTKIGGGYLIPMYGSYDKISDIDFDNLPNKFVIKCNHDSGSVTIIEDRSKLSVKKLKIKYDKYLMKRNYAFEGYEMQYANIKPQIIVESYLGKNISDYKFICFDGTPRYCWVDIDRFTNHKRNIYNLEWQLQPFNIGDYGNCSDSIEKPENFNEMLKIVKILCKGFDQVRVDLYDVDGHIYFGEMTFTSGNGFAVVAPKEWDYKLGEMWPLDLSKREEILKVYSSPYDCTRSSRLSQK